MKLSGTVNMKHKPEVVWDFLLNYRKSSQCIPGLQSLQELEPSKHFKAIASSGVGSIRATFSIDAEWLDLARPESAKMKVYATAPGNVVQGTCGMILRDDGNNGTNLDWVADVTITGTIAMLATPLIPSISAKLIDEFFDCVQQSIEKAKDEL